MATESTDLDVKDSLVSWTYSQYMSLLWVVNRVDRRVRRVRMWRQSLQTLM